MTIQNIIWNFIRNVIQNETVSDCNWFWIYLYHQWFKAPIRILTSVNLLKYILKFHLGFWGTFWIITRIIRNWNSTGMREHIVIDYNECKIIRFYIACIKQNFAVYLRKTISSFIWYIYLVELLVFIIKSVANGK